MAMYSFRKRIPNPGYRMPQRATKALDHLPQQRAGWLMGHTKKFLLNDHQYVSEQAKIHGNLFVFPSLFGQGTVFLLGAEANALVLGNAKKIFSNHHAYAPLRAFAGESIVTRDLDDHAQLRKIISPIFSRQALINYLYDINKLAKKSLDQIPAYKKKDVINVPTYPLVKSFAFTVASKVLMGMDDDFNHKTILDALTAILNLSNAKVPLPIPSTTYWKGMRGRAFMESYFRRLIPVKRESKDGDLFSQLCLSENECGERLSDKDVVDNLIGVMIAGHDTSTIAIVALLVELAKSPKRQAVIAAACDEIFERTGKRDLPFEELNTMSMVDLYVKEVLRRYTPIRYIQRRTTDGFTFNGYTIPANANVIIGLHHTHMNSKYFERPEQFLPERFSQNTPFTQIPAYAWAPFGHGAHACIGMKFTLLEIKAFLYQILLHYEVKIKPGDDFRLAGLPVAKPVNDVPLTFVARRAKCAICTNQTGNIYHQKKYSF